MERANNWRNKYGRYSGICASYHHSKGCICRNCPTYPQDEGFMYCAKGPSDAAGRKNGCMCPECIVYDKFKLEGRYFCQDRK
ncbi:conserved hypothetical protein [Methanosalsum zhilinae DSM 4017]|uniref:DUF2769 domain-containing protein n=1 Tax=Methanosalsum zhilinae (strain DSM 4017 / NBRC 107636 / OCM 62 / WeN5) TaxID=679901 RepID=F7XN72_METZD|nr:DUF2769 domain-containing protein [Methanosalsum zhilinae]AEH60029.1 conserved hypothetical protein [Methanosalsum zhilinae DSM 4017]